MFCPESLLPPAQLVDGAYFIHANPDVFAVILDYLRYQNLDFMPANLNLRAILVQAFARLPKKLEEKLHFFVSFYLVTYFS